MSYAEKVADIFFSLYNSLELLNRKKRLRRLRIKILKTFFLVIIRQVPALKILSLRQWFKIGLCWRNFEQLHFGSLLFRGREIIPEN